MVCEALPEVLRPVGGGGRRRGGGAGGGGGGGGVGGRAGDAATQLVWAQHVPPWHVLETKERESGACLVSRRAGDLIVEEDIGGHLLVSKGVKKKPD